MIAPFGYVLSLSDDCTASVETVLDGDEVSPAAVAAAGASSVCLQSAQQQQLVATVVPSAALSASAHRGKSRGQGGTAARWMA